MCAIIMQKKCVQYMECKIHAVQKKKTFTYTIHILGTKIINGHILRSLITWGDVPKPQEVFELSLLSHSALYLKA